MVVDLYMEYIEFSLRLRHIYIYWSFSILFFLMLIVECLVYILLSKGDISMWDNSFVESSWSQILFHQNILWISKRPSKMLCLACSWIWGIILLHYEKWPFACRGTEEVYRLHLILIIDHLHLRPRDQRALYMNHFCMVILHDISGQL